MQDRHERQGQGLVIDRSQSGRRLRMVQKADKNTFIRLGCGA